LVFVEEELRISECDIIVKLSSTYKPYFIFKNTFRKMGSFHETAKVVNSLRVSTAGITQCRHNEPSRERALKDGPCASRGGDLGGFSIHG